ncbi:hypothetical protein [Pseudomonas alloputida]|uniref:hypothetical protein n=1 Tax=Pseudomonas TaxID=286 RepID=UPI003EEC8926
MKKSTLSGIQRKFELLAALTGHDSEDKVSADLVAALSTQVRFASFESVDLGLAPCSLNSMKEAANELVPGGFETVNKQRELCFKKFSDVGESPDRADTVRALQAKNKSLEDSISDLEEHILRLNYLFMKIFQMYKRAAHKPAHLLPAAFKIDEAELNNLMAIMELADFWSLHEFKD